METRPSDEDIHRGKGCPVLEVALLGLLCHWGLYDRMVPVTVNLRSALATTAICVFIVACVFVGWAALLSMGDSLQPDANQEDILALQRGVLELRTEVRTNQDNTLQTLQYRLQDAGLCFVAADSSNRLRTLFRRKK